ncbi:MULTISPECIES: sensor histidine kinase [unclassified Curtobacterium]|uniref:sensor histidine kinase n=1 Tax=unclassified Curtobacterium TaxID=257496 RepID=UPI000826ADDC|nr:MULTISPECIES: histidine kinase [unclassified Curtobacterium]WIA95459.1 histidine kinase [Curtobacterium sp. MCBA15_004]
MAPADPRAGRRTDVLVAALTAVVSLGLLLGLPPLDAADPDTLGAPVTAPPVGSVPWTVFALVLLAQSAVLLAARRAPRTVLLLVAALPLLPAIAVPQVDDLFGLTALPVVVAVVTTALRAPLVRTWPALVGAAVFVALGTGWHRVAVSSGPHGDEFAEAVRDGAGQGVLQALGAVGIPLVVALVVRSRREVRTARRAEAEARAVAADARTAEADARAAEASAAVREQDARVDAAVSRERAAMARELHDIAAHHLSGIALMSAVIDRQIDVDPAGAHEGVRQVREQSTAVLEDLRRLVGLLRDDSPAERAVETVTGVADLVERARYRSDVHLEVLPAPARAADDATARSATGDGTPPLADGVGPLAQLAAYRTVQEALANAALHAPGARVTVTVDDRDADQVTLRVVNTAPTAPASGSTAAGGNGLRGMRERADLVGARLQTGPTDDGGWAVTLVLGREPRSEAEAGR